MPTAARRPHSRCPECLPAEGRIDTPADEVPRMAFAANVDRALLLRRQALKQAEGRRRLALLCLAVAVVLAPAGYWLLANSSAFAVSGVSVSGGGAIVSAEVRAAAAEAVGGRSLLQVDAGAIERAVERLPYVRTAVVDRAFPHTLSIQITTYRPAAAIRSGRSAYLVSSDGRVLSRDVPENNRLPVIRAARGLDLAPGRRVPAGDVAAALSVLRVVPHTFVHRVGHVRKLVTDDSGIVAVIGRGLQLRLGASSQLDLKLRVAVRVLRSMQATTRSALAYVDVSVPGRPALGYRHSTST
jgi:cell division protein FtsQ